MKGVSTLIALALAFFIGRVTAPDGNAEVTYSNGSPSNCRALIQANIDGWRNGMFNAKDILASIERNCGAHGYLWDR